MPTRKFAALSPVKQTTGNARSSKFVRLSDADEDSERRQLHATKKAREEERTRALLAQAKPSTPHRAAALNGQDDGTPRSMPILANFEEWMKLATDNKINAGNSWNFALIDYFHDMSLLREGDSINFQKASVTLDGCVKIYTNRVDSVATETGKLLSGLSSKAKDGEGDGEDPGEGAAGSDDEGDNDDDGDDETKAKKATSRRKKTNAGSTLAKDFSQLQVKKLDLEFFVDPLFKKTSAEFDEGGAKGLLLNHLSVDDEGRIIFDASDAVVEESNAAADTETTSERDPADIAKDREDIEALGRRFLPELYAENASTALDDLHVCPSLRGFKSDAAVLEIPLVAALRDADAHAEDLDDDDEMGASPASTGLVDVYDDNDSPEFGQVDDFVPAGSNFAHNMPSLHAVHGGSDDGADADAPLGTNMHRVDLLSVDGRKRTAMDEMYSHFDAMLHKNWAGPANWKITRVNQTFTNGGTVAGAESADAKKQQRGRTAREKHLIDFTATLDESKLFAPGTTTQICLPKTQWSSRTRNLLPEDKHFSSESLLRLFLKPKARVRAVGGRHMRGRQDDGADGDRFVEMDENFWAKEQGAGEGAAGGGAVGADFYNDDLGVPASMDDDEDDGPHGSGDGMPTSSTAFGDDDDAAAGLTPDFAANLHALRRKNKPEYVNFARTAKKVDVHVLKQNLWQKLDLPTTATPDPATPAETQHEERKFTEVVHALKDVYPANKLGEISTSFCFICLLHLANEEGLEITQADDASGDLSVGRTRDGEDDGMEAITRGMHDLVVRRDPHMMTSAIPAA
ncbi:hypothetical protein PYCC9005_000441 [Savitreella phatthalungensis]